MGIASSIVPVYQAEIAPKEIRGRVVSLTQWAITWGILIQYFIQYGTSFTGGGPTNPTQGTAAFRIPWGIQIIPALILIFGMIFCPRSPRWLGSQDQWEEAIRVLAALHANGDMYHPKVLAEYQEIEEGLRFEKEEAKTSLVCGELCIVKSSLNTLTGRTDRAKDVETCDLRNVYPDVVSALW